MDNLFVCYARCSTCKKAQAWMKENGIEAVWRDIKTSGPTESELRAWIRASGLPAGRFFNTSGEKYRSMGLAARRAKMSEDEQIALLATDGMLVKRPVFVGAGTVLVGFRRAEWEAALLK